MADIPNCVVEEPMKEVNIAQLNDFMVDDRRAKLPNSLYNPIVRQLPSEITGYIFNLLVFSEDIETPFILGAVCHDWRAIAWSNPVLWSSISIYLTKSTLNTTRISLISDWLGRSGELPLSICIIFESTRRMPPDFRAGIVSLANIINQYAARWFHFDLTCQSKIVPFFRAEECHAPILESLRVEMPACGELDSFAITCPRLRKLHLVRAELGNIQLNNVTEICMEGISLEYCLNILRSIPLLVRAELMGVYKDQLESSDQIVIPPLKSLKVVGGHNLELFHHDIACPALDELIFDSWGRFSHHERCITSFLASSYQLRSITILNYESISQIFIDILRAAPSLTKLVLTLEEVPKPYPVKEGINILDILGMVLSSQSDHSQESFLPNLESFEYQGRFSYARISSSPPAATAIQIPFKFAKFDFFSTTCISPDAISFFSSLIELGITVHVVSEEKSIFQSSVDYFEHKKRLLNQDWVDYLDISLVPDLS